ncbi:hypothetical protein DFJ43DRAFT_1085157 [Lentinula guzmanii]|uniref:Uncharacterized protein n=1 Tax=Lentinula guzmanii TaxID=2804957 RepID=A0AA38JJT9_9AGAR|nr:hypothetical protein DFJ43DRAFT_1085157 [Lentinula guzmanii]
MLKRQQKTRALFFWSQCFLLVITDLSGCKCTMAGEGMYKSFFFAYHTSITKLITYNLITLFIYISALSYRGYRTGPNVFLSLL